MKFTTHSRHVSLAVTFAVKLTFSGLTAERQKKRKIDQQRVDFYTVTSSFTMRLSNFFKIASLYIASIHDKNYLWIFSTKSCSYFDMDNSFSLLLSY